ncbi:entericidin A [Burkholderia sp. D7]|jgi:entericidin A|nr:entericidin A [Burkholderia sp. D7]HMC44701.1 entericidin A/B family lipoprotein [Caballeronia sp.]
MKRVFIVLGFIAVVAGVAGCNTVHGFGEDLHHLGNSISNAADK